MSVFEVFALVRPGIKKYDEGKVTLPNGKPNFTYNILNNQFHTLITRFKSQQ
jgi:hypothetical protein